MNTRTIAVVALVLVVIVLIILLAQAVSVRPVLVAPDKFKGTFTAAQVAAAVADGVRSAGHDAVELPVADGGDGTARAMLRARGGAWREVPARDPLGRPIQAGFAVLAGGRTAVVDVSEASGLWRLASTERDPWRASSAGTGDLVAAAAAEGVEEVVVAAGGSATVDGGEGALAVLRALPRLPRIVVACDVETPWEDAAAVFGPQKGATPQGVARLEERLAALARTAPRDPRGVPRTGAAGGLAGGMWAHLGASLVAGAALVLDAIGFDDALARAAFVVTGEGRLDDQTLAGKAVGEVARRASGAGIACDAIVGRDALASDGRRALGLRTVVEAGDEQAMQAAGARLARAGQTVLEIVTAHTADLDRATLDEARALLFAVFAGDMTDEDWEHALGGVHALARDEGALVGHASVVQRRLLHAGRALRCGYVEGVAVRPDQRRRGVGAALMAPLDRVIRGAYELGALGTTEEARPFYSALGWELWRGPTSALTPSGVRRTPDEDGGIYVLRAGAALDLTGELTCDWRDGEAW